MATTDDSSCLAQLSEVSATLLFKFKLKGKTTAEYASDDSLVSKDVPFLKSCLWSLQLYPVGRETSKEYSEVFLYCANYPKEYQDCTISLQFSLINSDSFVGSIHSKTHDRKLREFEDDTGFGPHQPDDSEFKCHYLFDESHGYRSKCGEVTFAVRITLTFLEDHTYFPEMHPRKRQRLLMDRDLQALGMESTTYDLEIEVEGGAKFKVHRCILAARSDYFKSMFGNHTPESTAPVIKIDKFPAQIVEAVLKFFYQDQCDSELMKTKTMILADAADYFQCISLMEYCELQLLHTLNASNWLRYLNVAEEKKMPTLKKSAINYLLKNSEKFLHDP